MVAKLLLLYGWIKMPKSWGSTKKSRHTISAARAPNLPLPRYRRLRQLEFIWLKEIPILATASSASVNLVRLCATTQTRDSVSTGK